MTAHKVGRCQSPRCLPQEAVTFLHAEDTAKWIIIALKAQGCLLSFRTKNPNGCLCRAAPWLEKHQSTHSKPGNLQWKPLLARTLLPPEHQEMIAEPSIPIPALGQPTPGSALSPSCAAGIHASSSRCTTSLFQIRLNPPSC